MVKKLPFKRLIAGALAVIVTVSSLTIPIKILSAESNGIPLSFREIDNNRITVSAQDKQMAYSKEEAPYKDDETVRVSIVLNQKSTIEQGFDVKTIAWNTQALSYRKGLKKAQTNLTAQINSAVSKKIEVVRNLTLAANIISANVKYGDIKKIEKISGVKAVLLETVYSPDVIKEKPALDPNMSTSAEQIGTSLAWAAGYTGAGTRIAIIDTGTDADHQSFSEEGYLHSLEVLSEKAGMTKDDYIKSLNLLTKEEIDSVKDSLNAGKTGENGYNELNSAEPMDSKKAYLSKKLPFAYNYVDGDYQTDHSDGSGGHGSHVAGIASANSYIKTATGFENALTYAHTQGAAPDAQLLTMKVFGKNGGAYDSDYMAAIEDAIVLKADSINLSLGSGNPGTSRSAVPTYQQIMEDITKSGVVVAFSAGNSGYWAENSNNPAGLLYSDDISMQTGGSPGSYINSFTVASIDNIGYTGSYIEAKDKSLIFYSENPNYNEETKEGYKSITTLAGSQSYILIDGIGAPEDWAPLKDALKGKIAVLSRGKITFTEKGNNAVEAGAVATIVYNNQPGTISMASDGYNYSAPYLSITQADGAILKANAEKKEIKDETGKVIATYYEGVLTIGEDVKSDIINGGNVMSDFSSWGAPGSLKLKPEITAPGGNIYSVDGELEGGKSYVNMSGTSMASPQIAGMSAIAAQYIKNNKLTEKTGLSARILIQSLLMSTATPVKTEVQVDEDEEGNPITEERYYPVFQQGAGLANINSALSAESYILMGEDATVSAKDGKIKVELGDDPKQDGVYTFSFTVNNITDSSKAYNLSADLFTQDLVYYYVNETQKDAGFYMDTITLNLTNSTVSFVCEEKEINTIIVPSNGSKEITAKIVISEDEKADLKEVYPNGFYVEGYAYVTPALNYDFNNDGVIDENDADAILDYRTTVKDTLFNKENADFNANGIIDTNDAYLFLEKLQNSALDLGEGAKGTTHSIPIYGFCGSWTSPSMYEKGSFIEYTHNQEIRAPYLGNNKVNSFGISYKNNPAYDPSITYYLGANPVGPDKAFMPERAAVNGKNIINMLSFAAIRNAAGSRLNVYKNDSEELLSKEFGPISSAFYYVNQGKWFNTSKTLGLDIVPEALGLKQNDKITLDFALAPEYYTDYSKEVPEINYEALGDGAHMSLTLMIDNTTPAVKKVVYNEKDDTLVITASDNQYVAGIELYNRNGNLLLDSVGSSQTAGAGEDSDFVFDMSWLRGSGFLIRVIDYANNVTTYECRENVGGDEPLPSVMAMMEGYFFDTWVSVGEPSKDAPTAKDIAFYQPTDNPYVAATVADHYVFAVDAEKKLWIMPENELDNPTYITDLEDDVYDLAYSKEDSAVFGIIPLPDKKLSLMKEINKLTGEMSLAAIIPDVSVTLAYYNGKFYYNPIGTAQIKAFSWDDVNEKTAVAASAVFCDSADIEKSTSERQAMEADPNTGKIHWSSAALKTLKDDNGNIIKDDKGQPKTESEYPYIEIDTEGKAKKYDDIGFPLMSLIIPDKTVSEEIPAWAKPTTEASDIIISKDVLDLIPGVSAKLSANVLPWTLTDRSVIWSSSDEKIAVVSEDGTVSAKSVGECVITATSKATKAIKAECKVTVSYVDVTISGALQDDKGKAQLFDWNLKEDEAWTSRAPLTLDGELTSLTASDKYAYIGTSADTYYQIDLATGKEVNKASGFGEPLFDMTYSELFSAPDAPAVVGVLGTYVLVSDPFDMKNSMAANLADEGVGSLIAITSEGLMKIQGYNAETFIAVDSNAKIWNIAFVDVNGKIATIAVEIKSDLPKSFLGSNELGEYCSIVMGDDGYYYLSAYNPDDDTNNIYRLAYNQQTEAFEAVYVNNVGEGVWPAAIYKAVSNNPAQAPTALSLNTDRFEDAFDLDKNDLVLTPYFTDKTDKNLFDASVLDFDIKKLDRAHTTSEVSQLADEQGDVSASTLETTLSVGQNTNGLVLLDYDPSLITIDKSSITGSTDHTSAYISEGRVIIAYANNPVSSVTRANPDENKGFNLKFAVKEGVKVTDSSTLVKILFAEAGDVNMIPTKEDGTSVSPITYDPKTDGYSEQIKQLAGDKSPEDYLKENGQITEQPMPVPPSEEEPAPDPTPDEPVTDEPATDKPVTDEPAATEPDGKEPDVVIPPDQALKPDDSTVKKPDANMPTGVSFAIIPVFAAAAMVVAFKKKK